MLSEEELTGNEEQALPRKSHKRKKAQQAKLDELSLKQQKSPQTVSQLMAQIRELQDKVNSLADARDFHDPETASSAEASHVTCHPVTVASSRAKLGRLAPSTRGVKRDFVERDVRIEDET